MMNRLRLCGRKEVDEVEALTLKIDPDAFITVEEITPGAVAFGVFDKLMSDYQEAVYNIASFFDHFYVCV